jgi:hypothetical protein
MEASGQPSDPGWMLYTAVSILLNSFITFHRSDFKTIDCVAGGVVAPAVKRMINPNPNYTKFLLNFFPSKSVKSYC